MKGKLIEFPESILEALAEYKKQTGISASDYIRLATCRRMIVDKIVILKVIEIDVERNGNGSKIKIDMTDAIESNKFCDGESCGFDPEMASKSC